MRAGVIRRVSRRVAALGSVLALAWLSAPKAEAHDFSITPVLVVLKSDGRYVVDMTVDVDALALGVSGSVDSAEIAAELEAMSAGELAACIERAEETLARRVRLRFDSEKQRPRIGFPDSESEESVPQSPPTVFGITARLTGSIPEGASEFSFGASRAFGPVQLTILDQGSLQGLSLLLEPGEDTPPYRRGETVSATSSRAVAGRYIVLGFEHILPYGLDHILFILGLFLLSTHLRPLLWQITAFTVAHSVTLGLCMAGVVSLPSRLVETLIALSIAYVAIENVFTSELKPWRPAMVFMFGLLHGMGFAEVLRGLGLPRGDLLPALIGFNLGVELGQVGVVLTALALVSWARDRDWYRARVVVPASVCIAAVGLYWAVERAS